MNVRQFSIAAITLGSLLLTLGAQTGFAQSTSRVSQAVRDRVAAEGRARVIVQLASPSPAPRAGRSADQIQQRRTAIARERVRLRASLRAGTHRVLHEFADVPYVALEVDALALADIDSAGSPAARVFVDRLMAPTLMESVPHIEANLAHEEGFDGAGTVVAVIDSGVDGTHPFLGGRLLEEACFATAEFGGGGDCPNGQATQIGAGAAATCAFAPLACGHGTHVSGIAVGSGTQFDGVAPGAGLIAIQVFHASLDCVTFFEEFPCPRAYMSDIVAALEHVLELRDEYNIAAVNMSLGGAAYDSACDVESPLFAAVIDNLKSVGIATVAASGNDGLTYGISEPACIASAISVGAVDDFDEVAWFSNVSADLDLLAPGTPIYSSIPGGGFEELEGTSMAAPHVAGAWAIYMQANPGATVDEALTTFVATGVPVPDWRGIETKPRIRVGAALGIEFEPGTATLTPSATSVEPGESVTVTLAGGAGGQLDWLALAEVGNPGYLVYTYVGAGVRDRTWTVNMPETPGEYEFRLYLNNTYNVAAVSPPVTVVGPEPEPEPEPVPATLTVSATTAAPGTPVTVTLAGAPGGAGDWLALSQVGSSASSYYTYTYVGTGVTNRTWTLNMPQAVGNYEFRLYLNGVSAPVAVSAPVTVAVPEPEPEPEPEPSATTLTVSATTAAPGTPVTMTLAGAPGGVGDWLALSQVGSASYFTYTYVGTGVTNRTWTLNMPQTVGNYEFRLYLNGVSAPVAVSPPVTVAVPEPEPEPEPEPSATTLTVSATTAAPGTPVTMTLTGAPGGVGDWLALSQVGSSASSYYTYTYVGTGVTNRTWTLNMPQAVGSYEFRLYLNGVSAPVAVSAPVTVALTEPEPEPEPEPSATTLTVSATTAAPGTPVTMTLTGAPGGVGDWLALSQVGSSAYSYYTYTYVGTGVTNRTWTLNMPQAVGNYEFRLYLNNGYTFVAVSAPVLVQ